MIKPVDMKEPPEESPPTVLAPTMKMLLQFGKVISPPLCHDALLARAQYLQARHRNDGAFKAEAKFMRVLQDGIDFGKWPV